jgi:hypothetical protein
MASSEPLVLSRRLMAQPFVGGSLPAGQGQRFPNLSCMSFDPCRGLYPGGRSVFDCCRPPALAFALWEGARQPTKFPPEVGSRRGDFSRLTAVRLSLRPGSWLALLRQGRLHSSFHPMSHLTGTSNMTTRPNSQLPRPDLHRLDTQPYGLRSQNVPLTPLATVGHLVLHHLPFAQNKANFPFAQLSKGLWQLTTDR